VALVAAAVLTGVAACGGGGDDDGPARPALDQVAPAVAAVELQLGGAQQYFEINATPQVVNLFVADADATAATSYAYVGGSLTETAPAQPAEGNTFAASALTFDPATMLDQVAAALPESDITSFSVIGGPGGAVQYAAVVQSEAGGRLTIVLAPDGTPTSTETEDG
jgi:hypothetical protein